MQGLDLHLLTWLASPIRVSLALRVNYYRNLCFPKACFATFVMNQCSSPIPHQKKRTILSGMILFKFWMQGLDLHSLTWLASPIRASLALRVNYYRNLCFPKACFATFVMNQCSNPIPHQKKRTILGRMILFKFWMQGLDLNQ